MKLSVSLSTIILRIWLVGLTIAWLVLHLYEAMYYEISIKTIELSNMNAVQIESLTTNIDSMYVESSVF